MKVCRASGCFRPVFSHGFCQSHQRQRTDEKYLRKQKESKEKRFTPQKKMEAEKIPIEKSFGYTNQMEMFLDLWHDRYVSGKGIICPFTGEKLDRFKGTPYLWNVFSHILNKKNYTYFRLNPVNIMIVHPTFHRIVDQGSTDDRKRHPGWKFDAWDALVIDMKEQYRKFKIENHLA